VVLHRSRWHLADLNLDYSTALLIETHIHGITLPEAPRRA
jgi:hypothetical protein